MMALFHRLRRSVALLIFPAMGGEGPSEVRLVTHFLAWLDSLRTDDFVGVIALFATVILLSSLSVVVP